MRDRGEQRGVADFPLGRLRGEVAVWDERGE
jgi:hypothetical protein